MKEVQVVVENLLENIRVTDRRMAGKLIDEHKITWIKDEIMKQDEV